VPIHSEFQEKMDVLDMIINILGEHEDHLSKIANRYENICKDLVNIEEKISGLDKSLNRLDRLNLTNVVGVSGLKGPLVKVECKDWLIFKNVSQGTLLVTFEVADNVLEMASVSDLFIFVYSLNFSKFENLTNKINEKTSAVSLKGEGIEPLIKKIGKIREIRTDTRKFKQWLQNELGVSEERIVEGRLIQ
jgi:archaellum component FlaC